MLWFNLVIRIGLEPMTYCLEGSCSIQLSYRTLFLFCPMPRSNRTWVTELLKITGKSRTCTPEPQWRGSKANNGLFC